MGRLTHSLSLIVCTASLVACGEGTSNAGAMTGDGGNAGDAAQGGGGGEDGSGDEDGGGGDAGAGRGEDGTPLTGVVAVTVNDDRAFALLDDGHVWGWGENQNGELGISGLDQGADPVVLAHEVPDLEGVIAVSTAKGATCAVLEAGGMVCWGAGEALDFAGMQFQVPTPATVPGAQDAVDVRLAFQRLGFKACTLDRDDEVHCFRPDGPTEREPVACVTDVASMPAVGLALTQQGEAVAYSDDGQGGCKVDVLVSLAGASALSAGTGVTAGGTNGVCAILDGEVSCSGSVGEAHDADLPQTAVALDHGTDDRRCALLDNGELWCWGGLAYSRLQMGAPRMEVSGDLVDFSVAATGGCAVLADTSVTCWSLGEPAALVRR
jgi:hypothetical protein